MSGQEILARAAGDAIQALLDRPFFYAVFVGMIVATAWASHCFMQRRWLRAIVCTSLAVEAAIFLCMGYA